jgi:hypothetical protein
VSSFDAAVGIVQGLRSRLAAAVKEPECASPRLTSPLKPQRLEPRMRALVDMRPVSQAGDCEEQARQAHD